MRGRTMPHHCGAIAPHSRAMAWEFTPINAHEPVATIQSPG
jgi:hypothetical protein